MKALLFFLVITALPVFAQVPDGYVQPEKSADVIAAEAFAQQFYDKAFSEDYRGAEKMMDPDPSHRPSHPLSKKEFSDSELRKRRIKQIEETVERDQKNGAPESTSIRSGNKFSTEDSRPNSEQFLSVVFQRKYSDGRKLSNTVTIIKKNGQLFVSSFS